MHARLFSRIFLLFAALWMVAGCAAQRSAAESSYAAPRLRVMSYNIHHGRGMDNEVDLERLAKVIADARPDVVSLQEVDKGVNRSGGVDEAAELGRLTGMHAMFGLARPYGGGEYGQAILSRRPIMNLEVHQLPGPDEQEQRIALLATIAPGDGIPELLFVGTHLHHQAEALRLEQARHLMHILRERAHSVAIVTGDINAMPGSAVMQALLEEWEDTTGDDALTFPATEPNRKIDWILLPKGHQWRVVSSEVIDEPMASDHRPVVVELEWLGGR